MDAVLKNADRCEFVMVAAPTDLSLTETDDLKRSLDESGVKAQRLVVNGVLDEAACKNFASSSSADAARELGGAGCVGAQELSADDSDGAAVRRGPRRARGLEALGGRYLVVKTYRVHRLINGSLKRRRREIVDTPIELLAS